jgi:uncharacterized protein (DUF1684 family)
MTSRYHKAAQLKFKHQGKKYILDVLAESNSDYFLMFSDETSAFSTYGGGRYLYIRRPEKEGGTVTIDFNRAMNPPCTFTDFATCPLPPKSNHLDFEIRAGERKWHD